MLLRRSVAIDARIHLRNRGCQLWVTVPGVEAEWAKFPRNARRT